MPDLEMRDFLPYLLNQAAEEVSLGFQAHYRERYGMLRTDWRVLFHLGRYGAMTASEIGARSRTHKTKVSRAVSRLETLRMLRRATVETDRRQELLELTPSGQGAYQALSLKAAEYNAELLAGLPPADQARLFDWLRAAARLD